MYRHNGIDPIFWPRLAGSWPGYVFTGEPLNLPAGHFGLGHGNGAHAPDEYYVIESANPKVQGIDGAAAVAGRISVRARQRLKRYAVHRVQR